VVISICFTFLLAGVMMIKCRSMMIQNALYGPLMLFVFIATSGFSQSNSDVLFTPFKGKVYKIQKENLRKGYGKHIENSEPIGTITLKQLKIRETLDTIPLQGIKMDRPRGFLFESVMKVKETGTYLFSISSDDGSILWIQDRIVIHNDGMYHRVDKARKRFFSEGVYPVRLWYYQGWPDEYHLILDVKRVPTDSTVAVTLTNEQLTFALDSYELSAPATEKLDSVLAKVNPEAIYQLDISGHTDDQGTAEYNKALSLKRATAVANYLKDYLKNDQIHFNITGAGETRPVADNQSEAGRQQNRRVELVFYY
jgi:outer membrane protein OmpA-like peptidoglycan-associated protein